MPNYIPIYWLYIITNIIAASDFFTLALTAGLPGEFQWQQVSSGL